MTSAGQARRSPTGEFRTATPWLKSPCVNGPVLAGGALRNAARGLRNARKTQESSEKYESEILVNGYKVARIIHKAKLQIAPDGVATAPECASLANLCYIFQRHRGHLKLPKGALGYTGHNRVKEPKKARVGGTLLRGARVSERLQQGMTSRPGSYRQSRSAYMHRREE